MKNIALVVGRGVDGCGVQAFVIEQYRWYVKNGFNPRVLVVDDKKWSRKESHTNDGFEFFRLEKAGIPETFQKALDASDLVILNSLPSVGHSEKCIAAFYDCLDKVKVPVVLVQHDHASMSIRRNARIEDAIKKADVIFGHADTSDFAKLVAETTSSGVMDLFGDGEVEKRVIGFQPGLDFAPIRVKYWKPIEEHDVMLHRWIGRTTSWKGYVQMFKFHNELLRGFGAKTIMEGIERSPAFLGFRELSEFEDVMTSNPDTTQYKTDMPVYVHSIFKKHEMLERMSKTGFGYQLSVLDSKFIDRSIEYTHCEIACTGTIPVFRKLYGQRCTHRKTGNRLFSDKNTGTVWFDDDNMQETLDTIKKLTTDVGMRAEWREMAYEYYKEHQDAEYTFREMHDHIIRELNK